MKISFFEKLIGSGLFTGYMPFASGTFASLAALIIYLIPPFDTPSILIFMITLAILLGVPIADKFENEYGRDPKQCTVDEFVGMWITLLFMPRKIWWLALAFIIWRFMDIVKPYPIKKLEKIKGGWGVMLDDILAGVYSFISIQLIIYFFNMVQK